MTTLITTLALLALTFACMWAIDKVRRGTRHDGRENVRRLQRYIDQLPPADPRVRGR